ncbi:probable beta-D-xylosidase 7 [Oryza brachyantha]|uniref:probable beta-D-xylosidase 7 n=1 Tax=Oryza brachyantha TaxID=4533 RepID=UPI001ADBEBC5|nr:probable beta-D-xylosidase 7 [Oryza brachyantha]
MAAVRVAGAMAVAVLLLAWPRVAVAGEPPYSCGGAQSSPPPSLARGHAFCDARLPAERRAADLVSRLTLAEKLSQLGDRAPGVPRLGVPAYEWWSEGLHGLSVWGPGIRFNGTVRAVTSFPQVILTAAASNGELWRRVGAAVGAEARALYNVGQANGLTIWSPNVNIFRDPRWGRGQETPGEDPVTASKYAAAFVAGLQGTGESPAATATATTTLQASACCKHATAYDLDYWNKVARYSYDSKVTSLSSSANQNSMTSDSNLTETVSQISGMDVNCGNYTQVHAVGAVQQGKLTEKDIDRALINLFAVRVRLGHFDGDPRSYGLYGRLGGADVCSPAHRSLAVEAAQAGIVLLKNDAGALPLHLSSVASVAAIGPNADNLGALHGNYFGPPCETTTPLQGIRGYVGGRATFLAGCDSPACGFAATREAAALASSSDHVVLFMGLSQKQEQEGLDRTSLLLPGEQQSLITAVANAARRPVILVLLTGGPVDVTFAKNNPKIGTILWAGYPGQAGGFAIARVLFGDHNPSGRLPVTWYPEEFTKIPMTDMRMRADPATGYPGRSYRFYQGKPVYKFGYGLSYSKFSYHLLTSSGDISMSSNTTPLAGITDSPTGTGDDGVSYLVKEIGVETCSQLIFPAVVEVQNHGTMDRKHSVLMYLRWPTSSGGRPATQLTGFQSQHLRAGEKAKLKFEVSPCEQLSWVREDGEKVIERGSHFLVVGDDEWEVSFGI